MRGQERAVAVAHMAAGCDGGPTPVSALVHSATMVAAGVYLVARLAPVLPPEVMTFIAYVGAITLLLGALQAMLADDLKQVLAWSTISQLGYMFVGLGTGGWTAGVFHLATHASFKALLFLSAGSVIVALHHVQDLRRMGGLGARLPWTAGIMLTGVVAISGLAIPFSGTVLGEPLAFSGHHSKDAILASALAFVETNPRHTLLFALPALGAGLTSYYMMRLWLMVFAGAPRGTSAREHVREPSPLLLWPMIVLAVPAMFAGWGGEHGPLAGWLEHSRPVGRPVEPASVPFATVSYPAPEAVAAVHDRAALFGLTAAFAGIVLAWGLHRLAGARAVEDPVPTNSNVHGPSAWGCSMNCTGTCLSTRGETGAVGGAVRPVGAGQVVACRRGGDGAGCGRGPSVRRACDRRRGPLGGGRDAGRRRRGAALAFRAAQAICGADRRRSRAGRDGGYPRGGSRVSRHGRGFR